MNMKRRTVPVSEKQTKDSCFETKKSQVRNVTETPKKTRKEEKKSTSSYCIRCGQILFLLLIVPPFLNYASIQKEIKELKPSPGELYDIGWGQKLFKMCQGKGPPTVIFDSPGGYSSDVWSLVWPLVAKHAKICIYDRAGLGFSDRPNQTQTFSENKGRGSWWQPFTVERMADDLFKLMTTSSQEPQPFILVGAELGALVSQFYAQMFDGQIMGLVLVNPLSDDLFDYDEGTWSHYWFGQMIPTFQSLQLAASLGLTRIALILGLLQQPLHDAKNIPTEVIYRQKHLMCHPKHLSSTVDEHFFINESFSQLRTARMLKSFPSNISVTVISGNYYDEQMPSYLNKAWAKSEQTIISKYYSGSKHILINTADRHLLYKHPDTVADAIIKQIKQWKGRIKQTAKE